MQDKETKSGAWHWETLELTAREMEDQGELPDPIERPTKASRKRALLEDKRAGGEEEELNEFELKRLERIRQNNAFLHSLCLPKIGGGTSRSKVPRKSDHELEEARLKKEDERTLMEMALLHRRQVPKREAQKPLPR